MPQRPPLRAHVNLTFASPSSAPAVQRAVVLAHDPSDPTRFRVRTTASQIDFDSRSFPLLGILCHAAPPPRSAVDRPTGPASDCNGISSVAHSAQHGNALLRPLKRARTAVKEEPHPHPHAPPANGNRANADTTSSRCSSSKAPAATRAPSSKPEPKVEPHSLLPLHDTSSHSPPDPNTDVIVLDDTDIDDVTGALRAPRRQTKAERLLRKAEEEEIYTPNRGGRTKNKKKDAAPQTTMLAEFDAHDMPAAPGPPVEGGDDGGEASTDDLGLEGRPSSERRIIKMLRTATHADTPEAEANHALALARRLLEKANLDEVELRAAAARTGGPVAGGAGGSLSVGLVEVRLTMRNTGKKVPMTGWILALANVVARNFEVKVYYQSAGGGRGGLGKSSVTFYGVKANCQLAALGFATYFDRIQALALAFRVTDDMYAVGAGGVECLARAGFTRVAKRSYCEGAVERMREAVEAELAGRARRRRERARAREKRRTAYERAVGRGLERCMPYDHASVKKKEEGQVVDVDGDEGQSYDGDGEWDQGDEEDRKADAVKERNEVALVSIVERAPQQALEQAGVKVSKATRRSATYESVDAARRKGRADAKGFDLNRQAICD